MTDVTKKPITQLITELSDYFVTHSETLGLAESCTGGLISSYIVREPGVSAYFLGSIISYARSVKKDTLRVPEHLLQTVGEVSRSVALAMAEGVRQELGCNWSMSVTGIAGPTGGTSDKPVGTVCFAVCGPDFERTEQQCFDTSGILDEEIRQNIQQASSFYALKLLQASLNA